MASTGASVGHLADNITGFGRALRRAGVRMDSSRMALAQQAVTIVGVQARDDIRSAMEAVMVSREQDREVFRELFEAYFQHRESPDPLLAALPAAMASDAARPRPRVQDALASAAPASITRNPAGDEEQPADRLGASELQRLRHADFGGLSGNEYREVERLARDVQLKIPCVPSRRTRAGSRGAALDWALSLRHAARTGGELVELRWRARRPEPVPLLVLVDVSGSMERYARLLLAFLHGALRRRHGTHVFAFGTHLTDLTPVFRVADTDAMLAGAGALIDDYGGGTRLGESLSTLRKQHSRALVGRRTVVLVISDGLETGEPAQLEAELAWIKRRCRRLLWLNPLLRYEHYAPVARGAAVLHANADAMVAVHNLSKLDELAARIADVVADR